MVRVEEFDSRDERDERDDSGPSEAGGPDESGAVADAIAAGTAVESESIARPSAGDSRADDIPRPVTVEPASDDANPRANMDLEDASGEGGSESTGR